MRRAIVASFAGALATPLLLVALRALGAPWWTAAPVALAAALFGARALARRLPSTVDDLLGPRVRLVAWCGLATVAVAQTARLSVFMLDAGRSTYAVVPQDDFNVHHSCYSAYYEAARFARDVSNVYDPASFQGATGRKVGPFDVDLYEYPPPFLLPFFAAQKLGGDFFRLRTLWFVLDFAIVAAGLVLVARQVGGRRGTAAALLAPLVLFTLPAQTTLQIGNFQLAALALAVVAMIAFERGRSAAGGALLAYVTVSKLFPGILLVVLLAQRRWRALAWTAISSAALVLATLATYGTSPFHAFFTYHLPRMASGAAFPFLESFPPAAAINHSVYGIALKLHHLGVTWATRRLASTIAWAYTAAVVVAAWGFARRPAASPHASAQGWIALVWLAALRSPFTPDLYATFGTLWLLTLVIVDRAPGWRSAAWFAGAWLLFNVYYVIGLGASLRVIMLITLPSQVVSYAVLVAAMWRLVRPRNAPEPVSPQLGQQRHEVGYSHVTAGNGGRASGDAPC